MEHAKETQQYTKYTQYINENVLNEKRNSSINIKCSKFVLFTFPSQYIFNLICHPFLSNFAFDLFERSRRIRKQRLDRIRHYKVKIDESIDR